MQMDKEQEIVIESGIITEAKFDETEFYQKEIEPRIMELTKLCKGKEIPFFSMIEFSRDDKNTTSRVIGNLPGARSSGQIRLIMKFTEDEKFMKKCIAALVFDKMLHGLLNTENNGGTDNARTDRN